MSVELAVRTLYNAIDKRIAPVKPFRAFVDSVSGGLVAIRKPEAAAAGTALYARLAGIVPVAGDEVLCLPLGKFPIIVGKIARDATGPSVYYGTGSPEGVVAAPIGAVYYETDGTSLTALWEKVAGTGVNGWYPVDGHTRDRWESGAHADLDAATISAKGTTAWTNPATVTNSSNSSGAYLNYATGAVSGNTSGPNGPLAYRPDWGVDCTFHVNVVDTTNVRIWAGLFVSDPSGTDAPTINCAGFRFSAGASDANWQCRTGDGAAGAGTDSGIAIAAGEWLLRILLTATKARFYINDAFVAERTTNLPSATNLLGAYCRVTTLTTAAKNIRFGYANALSR